MSVYNLLHFVWYSERMTANGDTIDFKIRPKILF